jgi:RNA 2',3'-cyclic 3'-phosphodiesterase
MKSGARRLFFALWPGEQVRTSLAHAAQEAIHASGGRLVPVSNWHSTLVYVGSVAEERMRTIVDVAASLRFQPFQLVFDHIEYWAKPAVLCAVATDRPLAAQSLVSQLRSALVAQGFMLDPKPWRPHITIARKVAQALPERVIQPIRWKMQDFALVESETRPEGARYTVRELFSPRIC